MAFNESQFRKDAADAGYSPEEIDAAVARQSANAPSPANLGPAGTQGMMAEVMSRLPEGAQTFQEDAKKMLYGGLGLAAGGGAYGLYKAYQAHQDRALDREIKQLQLLETKQRLGLVPPPAPAAAVPPAADFSLSGGNTTPAQRAAFNQLFEQATGQPPAAEPSRTERAAARIADLEARTPPTTPTVEPLAPAAEPDLVPNPRKNLPGASPWEPEMIPVERGTATSTALATGQSGNTIADAVVRDELAKPAVPPAAAEGSVAGRTRRTATQIEQDLAASFANAPPGMRPAAPRKTNKLPGDVIGQGGWHFFAGQGGNPEDWLRLYGRTPQPYNRVVSDIKGGVLPVPAPVEGKKGGAVPRGEFVPEYIKGRARPSGLVGLGAIAAALGLAGSEEGQKAMAKAAGAIKDIGMSPDIFQGKGEELGRLGRGYVTAGNPAYLRELTTQLQTETDPQRRAILLEEFQKAGGSGAGRGIAPAMR